MISNLKEIETVHFECLVFSSASIKMIKILNYFEETIIIRVMKKGKIQLV